MGVTAYYRRVTTEQLTHLQQCTDQATLEAFLYHEHRLPRTETLLWLEKAWGGVRAVLAATNTGQPIWDPVEGGTLLGSFHVGYGPVRFLTADEVTSLAHQLQPIDEAAFRRLFNRVFATTAPGLPTAAGAFVAESELQAVHDVKEEQYEEIVSETITAIARADSRDWYETFTHESLPVEYYEQDQENTTVPDDEATDGYYFEPDSESGFRYVWGYFAFLRDFVSEAAQAGNGLLFWLT